MKFCLCHHVSSKGDIKIIWGPPGKNIEPIWLMVNMMAKVTIILDDTHFFSAGVTTIYASHPLPVRAHLWSVVLWLQSQVVGCRSPHVVALVLCMGWCGTSLSGRVWPLSFYKQIIHQTIGFTATSLQSTHAKRQLRLRLAATGFATHLCRCMLLYHSNIHNVVFLLSQPHDSSSDSDDILWTLSLHQSGRRDAHHLSQHSPSLPSLGQPTPNSITKTMERRHLWHPERNKLKPTNPNAHT